MTLTYAGLTSSCDIVVDFDDTETGFAVCQVSGTFIDFPTNEHLAITAANVYFNSGTQMGNEFDWFFNPDRAGQSPNHLPGLFGPALAALQGAAVPGLSQREH